MRKTTAMWIGLALLVAASVFLLTRDSGSPAVAGAPGGPPPALPPGFPPVFPEATLTGNRTAAVEGGWQRAFIYSAKGKAAEIVAYYRRALVGGGSLVMAEGGGTYGGMLRAQDKDGKRMIYVDVEAPEDAPTQAPKITVTVIDKQ